MVEEYCTEDAEVVIAAYGISGRIAKSVVEMMRAEGNKVCLIHPSHHRSPLPQGCL